MTIVFLTGGLGNQMFQYACGRSLATKRGDELVLFIGALTNPLSKRQYSLSVFNIAARVETTLDFVRSTDVLWFAHQIDSRYNAAVFRNHCENIALRGYWESEKYFSDAAGVIRHDFTFRSEIPEAPAGLADQIAASESVCVHIRRTDTLRPGDPRGFVGTGYYEAAFRYMASRLEHPKFFIFSDDIEWCMGNLRIPHPHCFSPNDPAEVSRLSDSNELRLMSRCKHFIIANSTFSWWAAWLGGHAEKLVAAPRRWFVQEGLWHPGIVQTFRSDDLIPTGWSRL